MDRKQRPRPPLPPLSLVVPGTPTEPPRRHAEVVQARLEALSTPKQKRLFPVACRVVPTDQWFTSRVDRTWHVLDLKLWLLSKALPKGVLPLPAAFRPSSPVTFASPLDHAGNSSSYNTFTQPQPPLPQASPALSPPLPTPKPTMSPPKSPGTGSPLLSSSPVEYENDDYDSIDHDSLYDDALELDEEETPPRIAPRSIPYSFSTGAPAVSGLEVLKTRTTSALRGYGRSSSAAVDPALANKADSIGRRWRVYSYSTGMLLADDLPLSEYGIHPLELLELHRVSAYARLPRTFLPSYHLYDDNDPSSSSPLAHQTTSRAYYSFTTRRPSPQLKHQPASDTDDDESYGSLRISPYAQPYFDGWVSILSPGDAASKDVVIGDADGSGGRKVRRRARAKSDAPRGLRGKDRIAKDKERESSELNRLLSPDVEDGTHKWRRRWIMVRQGVLTVWKEKKDPKPEATFDVASCVALHDARKLPYILGSSSSSSLNPPSTTTLYPPRPIICTRFRATQQPERKGSSSTRDTRKGTAHQQRSPWLIMKLPDDSTHEHLLRIFHRLAYSTSSSSTHTSTGTLTRTLRTDFLPNPIPLPDVLSFGGPSPVAPPSDADSDAPLSSSHRSWLGIGQGMGVRFPEWREYILRRAIRAGQGLPPESTPPTEFLVPGEEKDPYGFVSAEWQHFSPDEPMTNAKLDSDSDSDAYSELEWEGWAYDLDRPHTYNSRRRGKRWEWSREGGRRRNGLKTPPGSPASERETDDGAPRRRTHSFVMVESRAGGPDDLNVSQPPTPLSGRLRASTVSGSSMPSNVPADEVVTIQTVATRTPNETGRMRGLMRGLSMRAGRETLLRSLENALDFVDGK